MQYIYAAGQNNGRVAETIDGISGETVQYAYDSLLRLASAQTTGPQWGEAYSYDGFGNLTGKTRDQTKPGGVPNVFLDINPATNQPNNGNYDANGNAPVGTWDIENHLVQQTLDGQAISWAYDPSGKRVMKYQVVSGAPVWTFYVYNASGQRLAEVTCTNANGCAATTMNTYFGGKLIAAVDASGHVLGSVDRLGTVRAVATNGTWAEPTYFPYGEQKTAGGVDTKEQFATYVRDSTPSAQDYAMQRYYSNVTGRFYSPDPGGVKTAILESPQSWNRYAYTRGDPINRYDPGGLWDCPTDDCPYTGVIDTVWFIRPIEPTYTSAFGKARSNLGAAVGAFEDRSSFSQTCQNDIAAIAAASPSNIDPSSITTQALQAAASATVIANGVGSMVSQAVLYPNSYQAQENVADQTIGALFSDPTKLVTAVTILGGSTIYINPSAISSSLTKNEGLLMHELLHELGLDDDAIGAGLHSIDPSIKPDANGDWTNTQQFSNKLGKDCFTGKDNKI